MCIFDLAPRAVNMLRAPRYLNPALVTVFPHLFFSTTLLLTVNAIQFQVMSLASETKNAIGNF